MIVAAFTIDEMLKQLGEPITLFGFAANFVFFMRFAVQWYASERAGRSVIPVSFWWLSIVGSVMIFVFAYQRKELVFMVATVLQLVIYIRNLALIRRSEARAAQGA